MQLFSLDDESVWVTSLTTKYDIFDLNERQKEKLTYNFHTRPTYSKFVHYFTEAYVGYIKKCIVAKHIL